jgi:RES domain-containing protein
MSLMPHGNFAHFYGVLSIIPGLFTPWKGDVLRQAPPRWLSRPYRFTGAGSVLVGGRWSVKNLTPTIYSSTDPDTLNAEVYYKGRRYGWTQADFKAQLKIGMHWELQAVVDLTDAGTLRLLKVKKSDLLGCDWVGEQGAGREALTQALARAAFENLAEGLVVPSARHSGGINVVYYPSHKRDGTMIQTLDESSIPFLHGL